MIVVSTLLCDRKASSQLIAIPQAMQLRSSEGMELCYYINIETRDRTKFQPLLDWLGAYATMPYDIDYWSIDSTWIEPPQYDQDQRRLHPILLGRTMARNYALAKNASHLYFVDADVLVPEDSLTKLLELDVPLCGGQVPGRGAHANAIYKSHPDPQHNTALAQAFHHGTCGCCLIRRDLLSTLNFRYGASRLVPTIALSEDPCLGEDSFLNGFGRWMIREDVRCQHWDDPGNPLRADEVARDSEIAK